MYGQSVYGMRHLIRQKIIHQAMPGQRKLAPEGLGGDMHAVMTRATAGAGMPGMQMGLILDTQFGRAQGREALADKIDTGIAHGLLSVELEGDSESWLR